MRMKINHEAMWCSEWHVSRYGNCPNKIRCIEVKKTNYRRSVVCV
jgi:hypothetical protein